MDGQLEILNAFRELSAEQTSMALATIVAIEGSSYRRLGARMLIAADGRQFGSISGGCLEADVARRGRQVIDNHSTVLCRYETGKAEESVSDVDDEPFDQDPGVALGCGGAVEILIQPVSAASPAALAFMQAAIDDNRSKSVATLYRIGGVANFTAGTVLPLPTDGLDVAGYPDGFHRVFVDSGWTDVLIETFAPPTHLMILGDGPDVLPLIELARFNGWRTSVTGYRSLRLPCDDFVRLRNHEEDLLEIDPAAAVVLMTHDLRRDARLLRRLAASPPAYVGVLGPLHRTKRLLDATGISIEHFEGRLFAPIGLDLGGDGPRPVALSIIAEIAATLSRHAGGHLRDKDSGIHESTALSVNHAFS